MENIGKTIDKIVIAFLILLVGVGLGYAWRMNHESVDLKDVYRLQKKNTHDIVRLELKVNLIEEQIKGLWYQKRGK